MTSKTETIDQYLNEIPEERKKPISAILKVLRNNLPKGFEEGILYGMIGFYVPKELYPPGYHASKEWSPLPFINLASQKNFIALYHSGIYAIPELHDWWVQEYPKHSKYKLDMGKSCVRFKKIDHIPLELIAELAQKITPEEWIKVYEDNLKR
ncbi:hypothetical protein BST97_07235 [Nonlabens spongiae]|uniref:YdhG-like domain-containing protein n=1 Tax=Nonlabens spongiae TaxID=331648 RepID=A0A1W6MK12_9FLAO|nr:DUF1801 domain-containing protein [Nonlabens spongiae]ARN77809.1 hypothetical protein BST97_07235 [Nonlabens spongiae]